MSVYKGEFQGPIAAVGSHSNPKGVPDNRKRSKKRQNRSAALNAKKNDKKYGKKRIAKHP